MNFIVFESGSRAGLSAELFFEHYVNHTGAQHHLYLSDFDESFQYIVSRHPQVHLIHDSRAFEMLEVGNAVIFPADELTRQRNEMVTSKALEHSFSSVEPFYYQKMQMNEYLAPLTANCVIQVPRTFMLSSVCIKPNSMSAGSRNIQFLDNACVTQKIDIEHEFVVDVLRYDDDKMYIFPREVTLKNGYDRFVKLLPLDGELATHVTEFVKAVCPRNDGVFSDIFHLQLCQDKKGQFYYIEFSKRISGTSCVNLVSGMSPFAMLDGVDQKISTNLIDGNWRRFEDFLLIMD
jgi:hypothetical protein